MQRLLPLEWFRIFVMDALEVKHQIMSEVFELEFYDSQNLAKTVDNNILLEV
jgi:hypothetical protein